MSFTRELGKKFKEVLLSSPLFHRFARTTHQISQEAKTKIGIPSPDLNAIAPTNEFTRFLSIFWQKLKDEFNKSGAQKRGPF